MNRLTEMYLNAEYDELLRYSENIRLLRDRKTGRLCIQKLIENDNADIYRTLCEHPLPGIPHILSVTPTDNGFTVLYEYIEGVTVKEYIARHGRMDFHTALICISAICNTLSVLHSFGIVHRDITAANVIIGADGGCYLIDFGISRKTDAEKSADTRILGTAGFAPPEQFGFRQTDAKSDIYSTGVLFNYMLTGGMPDKAVAPPPFRDIINRCTALDPANRYASAAELNNAVLSVFSIPVTNQNDSDNKLSLICLIIVGCFFLLSLPLLLSGSTQRRLYILSGLVFIVFLPAAAIADPFDIIKRLAEKYEWRRSERIGIRVFIIIGGLAFMTIFDKIILRV